MTSIAQLRSAMLPRDNTILYTYTCITERRDKRQRVPLSSSVAVLRISALYLPADMFYPSDVCVHEQKNNSSLDAKTTILRFFFPVLKEAIFMSSLT